MSDQLHDDEIDSANPMGEAYLGKRVFNNGDQTGKVAEFIRNQPVLSLSIAFGLGLLATSLLAQKRS